MTDPQERNHWRQVASELGALPPHDDEDQTPAPLEQPDSPPPPLGEPPTPEPNLPPRAVRAKPKPANWSQLAQDLGADVVGSPEPSEEPARDEFVSPGFSGDLEEPAAVEPAEPRTAVEPEADIPGGSAWGEPADKRAPSPPQSTSPRTDLVPTDEQQSGFSGFGAGILSPAPKEPEEKQPQEADEAKRVRKRKRRRRRPLKDREAESVQQVAPKSDEEAAVASTEVSDQDVGASPPSDDDTSAPPKRRRRGRRGSGRRRAGAKDKDRQNASEEAKGDLEPVVSTSSAGGDGPEGETPTEATDAKPGRRAKREEDAPAKSGKTSHRSIPSWQEAIDVIISSNLEKRPQGTGGNSRSRGGRGRGGRGRSSDKQK